jgi:hypothetical protein
LERERREAGSGLSLGQGAIYILVFVLNKNKTYVGNLLPINMDLMHCGFLGFCSLGLLRIVLLWAIPFGPIR